MSNIIQMPRDVALSTSSEIQHSLQLWANTMPVTPDYFAEISCEGTRASGVLTHLDTCTDCGNNGAENQQMLNACVRKQLWWYLFLTTQEMEANLHWTMSPRLITDTLAVRPGRHLQTYFGGITDPMAAMAYQVLADKASVSYWIATDILPTPVGNGNYYFDLPMSEVADPSRVMLAEQGALNTPETGLKLVAEDFYGNITRNGTNWRITIPGGKMGADGGVTTALYSVFSPDYGFVYIPASAAATVPDNQILANAPFLTGSTSIVATYPGTLQAVVMTYDCQVTYGGVLCNRYRATLETLVDPVFDEGVVDITSGDFYKFCTSLDLVVLGKQFAPGVFHYSDQVAHIGQEAWRYSLGYTDADDSDGTVNTQVTTYACVEVLDAERGLIAVKPVTLETDDNGDLVWGTDGRASMEEVEELCSSSIPTTGRPKWIVVQYAVEPYATGIKTSSAIERLRYAIACRTAAELPLDSCGCTTECGFIAEQRQFYDTTTYLPTGAKVVSLRYGKRLGQKEFATALDTAPRVRRAAP